jgi:hypothetical protein
MLTQNQLIALPLPASTTKPVARRYVAAVRCIRLVKRIRSRCHRLVAVVGVQCRRLAQYIRVICDGPAPRARDADANGRMFSADFLLLLVTPHSMRECLLGDLHEEVDDVQERFGTRRARMWYWAQVLCSLWPILKVQTYRRLIGWRNWWLRHEEC